MRKSYKKKTYETVRGNSAHFRSLFRTFFPVLAGENAAKHALSLDLKCQCWPKWSAQITLRFSDGRNTQLRHETTFVFL
jgi:hypothetical protein